MFCTEQQNIVWHVLAHPFHYDANHQISGYHQYVTVASLLTKSVGATNSAVSWQKEAISPSKFTTLEVDIRTYFAVIPLNCIHCATNIAECWCDPVGLYQKAELEV